MVLRLSARSEATCTWWAVQICPLTCRSRSWYVRSGSRPVYHCTSKNPFDFSDRGSNRTRINTKPLRGLVDGLWWTDSLHGEWGVGFGLSFITGVKWYYLVLHIPAIHHLFWLLVETRMKAQAGSQSCILLDVKQQHHQSKTEATQPRRSAHLRSAKSCNGCLHEEWVFDNSGPILRSVKSMLEYTFAPLPQTARGESIKLGGDPKGKNFVYTNGKSVFVRDIEVSYMNTQH